MSNRELRVAMDYMVGLRKSGIIVSGWRLTEKSLIWWDIYDVRNVKRISKIEGGVK